MKTIVCFLCLMMVGVAMSSAQEPGEGSDPSSETAEEQGAPARVALETSKGRIVLELDAAKAPLTVASFLENVDSSFYEGTIFHRVIPNFMIQGGGFTATLQPKPTEKLLENEADNGLANVRGSVAMARRGDPHSASVQFFVNIADNEFLNHSAKTMQGWGYTVFGRVVEGMEVVDAIAAVETAQRGPMGDVPVEAVVIESAARLDP